MQRRPTIIALVLLSLFTPSFGIRSGARAQALANPIRKVVTMLQNMQKKVEEEGEKEKKVFEKMMCYCKDGEEKLEERVDWEEGHIPEVKSDLGQSKGSLTQLNQELKQAQKDRDAALQTLREAAAIRDKEHDDFRAQRSEYDSTLHAIDRAITALEKGVAGSFLQSSEAIALKRVVAKANIMEDDRQQLVAFLTGSAEYAPQSGQIIGILKQMRKDIADEVHHIYDVEEEQEKSYRDLYKAKMKEVDALRAVIEKKTSQIGELGVEVVAFKEDLDGTLKALLGDKGFLANLDDMCAQRKKEWATKQNLRTQELLALAETIKILNDDDALELFKKTLPSTASSFIQMSSTESAVRTAALSILRKARDSAQLRDRTGLDQLVLALTSRGKKAKSRAMAKGGFDKVIRMIDTMVQVLKDEQQDDDHKKEYCEGQFDHADDSKKALERTIEDEENAIQTTKDNIATLISEIEALEKGIVELDKSVQEATETRKEEHADFKEMMASNGAAKELLGFAKTRLNKFYNPKLVPPEEEAESFLQVQQAPPAPEVEKVTWNDNYKKKNQESTGVISMIDLLVKDLDKEITEGQTSEKSAQEEYEKLMSDSAEKRVTDSKSLTEKSSSKAELEESLESHKQKHKDASSELMATMKYIASLHAECDFLMKYFDVRKEARSGEIDSLQKTKAVLSGSDYSM